jgi:hypothetical protein
MQTRRERPEVSVLPVVISSRVVGRRATSQEEIAMDAWVWILIAIGAVLVIALITASIVQRRVRRRRLRDRFGPEYDRRLDSAGSRRQGERELAGRADRRADLDIRPLSRAARARYTQEWAALQTRFVDVPQAAVVEADELITQVMRERGYPVDDFDVRSDLVSVDHPDVVQNYRTGHEIREKSTKGDATTEDLREAVVAYRALFEELVTDGARSREHSRS